MGTEGTVHWPADATFDRRLAMRLASLRLDRGWSLDALARQVHLSRSTLSRIERLELSPSAAMLASLCAVYGWTVARLVADAEGAPAVLFARSDQPSSVDHVSGCRRRVVSPAGDGLRGALVEVHLPANSATPIDPPPGDALETHLWLLQGALIVDVGGQLLRLRTGDCLRSAQTSSSGMATAGARGARFLTVSLRS